VDLFPNVDFPVAAVTTVLPGASVEEMETSVTKPIEDIINTISGIEELRLDDPGGGLGRHGAVRALEERRRRAPGGPRQGQLDPPDAAGGDRDADRRQVRDRRLAGA
jgi:hypothetical protein